VQISRITLCALALGATAAASAQVPLQGRLEFRWGDPAVPAAQQARFEVDLLDDAGTRTALDPPSALAAASDLLALNRRPVALTLRPGPWLGGKAAPEAMVDAAPTQPEPAILGSQPWVTLLCKFSDNTTEPKAPAYFSTMLSNTTGRLDHYWREVSYNKANVANSAVYGWFTLPQPRSYYIPASGSADLTKLFTDCTAAADATVNFAPFVGINTMYNGDLDGYAWGGNRYAALDGPNRNWYVTWEPPWGYANEAPLAHEMGHGFGLPHANNSDGDTNPYDNPWDVMSDSWSNAGSDATYGAQPKHINTYSRNRLGWIDDARKLTLNGNGSVNGIVLDRASLIGSTKTQMIVVTLPAPEPATHYFIVEARKKTGYYEANLAGDAVIIHEVNTSWPEPSHSIDADSPPANTSNNPGSMFVVGESWTAPGNLWKLSVTGTTAEGFIVNVRRGNVPDDTIFTHGYQ
jgi:hypothetical protein